ncbi:MAG: hypothetical protein NT061_04960 [Spirochaetes bacterium]|nr:hypothetical protein [Spirochaetota bacterium]
MKVTALGSKRFLPTLAVLFCVLLLGSCMGMDTEVKISKEGSGTLSAQYRLSEELVSFGELEANKDMLPVPLSESDVRKSLDGVKGLSFKSWSSKKDGTDLLITTVIGFDSLDSLVLYLDPQGMMASHTSSSGSQSISFTLGNSISKIDKDMKEMAKEAFAPYTFRFVFDLPEVPKEANSSDPAILVVREGKKVRFEGKMSDIVTLETAPSLQLSW